jgi:hypothetical protein
VKYTYRAQRVKCKTCKGAKRVVTLRYGSDAFERFVGEPLLVSPQEAIAELQKAKMRASSMEAYLIDQAVAAIGEGVCPRCRGTGSSFEMRQLTPEEAKKLG